jgi:hypothetical protein
VGSDFRTAVVAVLAILGSAPAASAAISVGDVATKPSEVSAPPHCDTGTWAVTSTGVAPRYEVPGDGVLTSWRTYTGGNGGQGPVRLKVIRPVSPSTFKVISASDYINPVYDFATNNGANGPFPTRIPVVTNDLVALGVGPRVGSQSMPACQFNNGKAAQSMAKIGLDDPADEGSVLTWGSAPFPTLRVAISASLEPDLDHDAFGDETQDRCPTVAGQQDGCPPASGGGGEPPPGPAPVAAAVIGSERLAPSRFRAAPTGPSARSAKRHYGTRVSYTLDQAASVSFTVRRARPGRKNGRGRCVAATKRNRKARKCKRLVTLRGNFTQSGIAGTNGFRFTGRIGGKALRPGRYKLAASPTANGRLGRSASASFRIVK